jgi:pyridoxal phosphate enzyme (YggS family)
MIDVRENCHRVLDRMNDAAVRSGRTPSSVRLIAVTKTVPVERIREACECGIANLGENRLQEALSKIPVLADLPVSWHFIGHLQSNKAKKVIETFSWVQSVDRLELAEKLNQYATAKLPVLVEVNVGNEDSKSGIAEASLPHLLDSLKACTQLDVRGFMAIPPFHENADDSRPYFARLRGMKEKFGLAELSMGMSQDFEVAIEEGATMIRVGTALFGARG